MALGELVDRASSISLGKDVNMTLRVKSDFNPGSFEVGFEIVQSFYSEVRSLFGSSDLDNALKILNILGVGNASLYGFFKLIIWLRNREQKPVKAVGISDVVLLELEDGSGIEIEKDVFDLYNDKRAIRAAKRFIEPLEKEGVDEIAFRFDEKETLKIHDTDTPYFHFEDDGDSIRTENLNEVVLLIIGLSFKPGEKWRVSDGSNTPPFYVGILDEGFLESVIDRKILFGTNDRLHVQMRTIQESVDDKLKISRDIIKVLGHMPSEEETTLDF